MSAEITRATNADDTNATAISNEVARATLSEQQNATDIDAIEALIPSQATSENQLADKAFVNSSIATSTATFVGTFNSITDLYAVTTADVNDYGYVVTTDSVGNTKYNRYKYDGSQWDFEYSLNNSSFTAEEWASIQSGMTQALREKLESLPSSATTSIGISVPTGFTVTGSPIVSSGTIAINFENGYSIPTIASQTNWDTAYSWGNHANAGYVKQVKVGTDAYNPTGGIVSLPAYPTSVYSATKLQTPRTIWGQSFDGTGNVSGNITGVGDVITNTSLSNIYYKFKTDSYSWWVGIGITGSDDRFVIYNATANLHTIGIEKNGNVGIGTSESGASYKLHVNGDAAATNFYTTSDSSKKDNITLLSEHIRKFTLKETGKEHYGVIAQEVEEMFREGEEGSYTVNYNSILSYYIGLLENRVAELENKVKELSHG